MGNFARPSLPPHPTPRLKMSGASPHFGLGARVQDGLRCRFFLPDFRKNPIELQVPFPKGFEERRIEMPGLGSRVAIDDDVTRFLMGKGRFIRAHAPKRIIGIPQHDHAPAQWNGLAFQPLRVASSRPTVHDA